MNVEAIPPDKGCLARTLIDLGDKQYEVATYHTKEQLEPDIFMLWAPLLAKQPYETTVYQLIAASHPLSSLERNFIDMIGVNEKYRRDLDLGDLYIQRTATQDEAALEHDSVVTSFVDGTIILFTVDERNAVFGPNKIV